MNTYNSIQERLDELNKKPEGWTVLDSIDRPMRPLIIELNRIGMQTHFCCCGYTYPNQEEPKSHLESPNILFEAVGNFVSFYQLVHAALSSDWKLNLMSNKIEWSLHFNDKGKDMWKKGDNLPEAIHDYESKMMAIRALTEQLKPLPTINSEITLQDGNIYRKSYYGDEWAVEPKKSTVIPIEDTALRELINSIPPLPPEIRDRLKLESPERYYATTN